MFVKWQDHVYDFEIMIWNHVSDSGKSNAPQVRKSNRDNLWAYHISSVIRRDFSIQNNPKNQDQSYKMDLNLWDYLGRVNLVL